jgi:DNA mismatch repair protein MutL
MSSIIQLLPDHVANQIAAGEVVQRPASVVKELLENAIDAGASDIKLICKEAGKTLVQVIDNGKGMSVTDARLCFERHATSKIRKAEDLFDLHTKGFRGEALASIAAIAHVELKTKQDQEELGTHLIIEGSKFISQEVAVLPVGTSFSVKNLFYNIPARRNFLKSDIVELRHVIDEFQRVALAHANISFTLYHNGSELFNLSKSNLKQRIVNLLGGKTNEKLIPVTEVTDILTINGFVGKPEFAKKNRGEQFFFVNDRYIKSGYLHHAIISAFEGLLRDGSQPSYFLYLTVPPHTIDINIHPTKTELKFDDEQSLYAILRSATKHSLGQFNIAPVLDFNRDFNLDTPYDLQKKEANYPTIQVDSDFNPFQEEKKLAGNHFKSKKENQPHWESLYVGSNEKTNQFSNIDYESEATTGALFSENDIEKVSIATYQIHKKYIVNPIKSGMLIIDQHRAHERILYEKFLKNLTIKQANSQQLLFPLSLYFSTNDMVLLKEIKASLENTGFVFDAFEQETVVISGLPVTVTETEVNDLLAHLVSDLQQGIPESSFSQMDCMAKSMAKSLAVKAGVFLSEEAQENIVNKLFACKEASVSPFNKTTFITLSVEDLDKKFNL